MKRSDFIEKRGSDAVRKLRLRKLQSGLAFMINSKDLIPGQAYLEYPDGKIFVVTFKSASRAFSILHELSSNEADRIRSRYRLYSH